MREKWNYFLGKLNFSASALDAKAIQIMNELGTEMEDAENQIAELKERIENSSEDIPPYCDKHGKVMTPNSSIEYFCYDCEYNED